MKITLEKTNKKRILLGLTLSLVCFVLCWIVSGSLVKSAVLALFFVMIS